MLRIVPLILFSLIVSIAYGQREERLPADLRQHNLTTYNASLFNPAFSLDRNNPQSLALWVRWQWQKIDSDPTTIFLNYTRKLNERSAAGAAFFQQNTGVFFNTGGALNYAYRLELNKTVRLSLGMNLFAFKQTLADDRFQADPDLPLPLPTVADDFILQMAPGVSLSVERLTFSMASENLFDYNFSANESNTEKEDKIFMALISYDFPIALASVPNAFLRPSMYLRTIPGQSNQVGFYTLFNTNKYWGQVGYNNFYGYAVGVGGTFFKHLSLGALIEFGTSSSINTQSSFELMAAYFLGKPDERHKVVGFDLEAEENPLLILEDQQQTDEKELEEAEKIEVAESAEEKRSKKEERLQRQQEKSQKDSIAKAEKEAEQVAKKLQKELEKENKELAKKEEALAETEMKERQRQEEMAKKEAEAQQIAEAERREQVRKTDSINKVRQAEAQRVEQGRIRDSIAQQKRKEAAARDSIAAAEAKRKEAEAAETAVQTKADKPKEGEKYEEVTTEDGLEPGYYLIANVFGTKKYFEAFMADLRSKGLEPKSFLRSKNNFNYTYLDRYDTMTEARQARDNNYGGKYTGNTWIFRVVGR